MNMIKIGSIVLKMMPIIVEAIHQIEELDSSSGKGQQKLQAALIILKTIYETTDPNPTVSFEQLTNTIQGVIAALVGFYNATGKFVKNLKQEAA